MCFKSDIIVAQLQEPRSANPEGRTNMTMQHIRPWEALHLFETRSYYDRLVKVVLPDIRSPMAIETAILLALLKYIQPLLIFEFGTFLGITTLNIAANMREAAIVYTLDLDENSFQKARQHPVDKKLSMERLESEHRIAFMNTPYESRIKRLFGDSNMFDFAPFERKVNMIYIDGGHDLRTVRSDTHNSFRMIDTASLGCIVWHDYGNPDYPELTQFIDELSLERELKHVEETMTVFLLHKL